MSCSSIPHLRWYVAGLLFTATVINYVDRQTLSVVAPLLTRELGLSEVQYANIVQAFLIAYTVMYVGSGIIADRIGTRWSLALFMVWWSISNALHAASRSAFQLGVFRFLLGAGESGNFMAANKAVSEWYPPREKALANGIVQAGASVGAVVAAPLVVWITMRFGWRVAFVATSTLGFVWLAAWLLLYYVPESHPRITREELNLIRGGSAGSPAGRGAAVSWLGLLRYRQTWGLLLARFISDPVWWFYLFWLPKYLVEKRGFTLVEVGMFAWLPYLAADVGAVLGGLVSGTLVKRNVSPLRARTLTMLPAALLMPFSAAVGLAESNAVALALVCLATFAHMAWKTNLTTVNNDIYPASVVGSVSGIAAFGSGLGAALFTTLAGRIIADFSYATLFVAMGFLHPAAFLVYKLLVRGEISVREDRVPVMPAR